MYSTEPPTLPVDDATLMKLADDISRWAQEFGFDACAITDADPGIHAKHLNTWLDKGYHGEMDYMARHASLREEPARLVEGAQRVISVRMNYLSDATAPLAILEQPELAYISRYTLGRDYHRTMRSRLAQLAKRIDQELAGYQHRAFVDSAPVLERGMAQKAGLGWIGKNTLLISREVGSFFFLGEILTSAPLPTTQPYTDEHCGTCRKCLDLCPTNAFVGPYVLDARRCISYLTIELKGSIPEEFRAPIGNRIFGCDDCQLVCPWNRFSQASPETDFRPRHTLDNVELASLFYWTEDEFLQRTEGSAIRRTGYEGWLRNIAVALGNAPSTIPVLTALESRQHDASALVVEHVRWALAQHQQRGKANAVIHE